MKRTCFTIVIIVALLVGFAAAGFAAPKWTLKCGTVTAPEHSYNLGVKYFAEIVERETGGQVKVEVYPNSILGDEDDLVEGMLLGTIDMAVAATAKLSSFVPEADLFSLPFLFRDYDHWAKVLDGPQGARMKEIIESKSDLILLGYWGCGTRMLFNSQKPVVTPDDLRGLKIRTMPGPVDIQTWEDLGAIPTPVAWPELYSALKQGVVDGAENDPANIIQQKFYEPCPYISLTDHQIAVRLFLLSKLTWDRLPEDIQEIIVKAAAEATLYQREVDALSVEEGLAILEEQYGAKINQVDKAKFIELTEAVRQDTAAKLGLEDMYKAILETK
ncbi:MAG: TRAP transporter substrate-binding protein [Firmicutes bacterium]|nr:TRAP transporter substrate-binding protein [Bacillota bacterium]